MSAPEELGWLPIETAPKDRDVWVAGLARIWANSIPFQWQGQAGSQSEWLTDTGTLKNVWATTTL